MNWIKTFLIQVSVAAILFFGSDFIYTNYFRTPTNQESVYRIKNDIFHHSLLPSFDGIGNWGGKPYKVCTDVNGFKIDCENTPYETGGGYDPENKKQIINENSQIGIVVDIKENYKYIIFSSTVQRDIPLGSKIVIDGSSKIYGEVARRYEGFYSAKVDNLNYIEKGLKIHNANGEN